MRMLDNVIDINFYPRAEARNANLKQSPDWPRIDGVLRTALYKLRFHMRVRPQFDFSDWSMELISFETILASTELAAERGVYQSYPGSKCERGLLPSTRLHYSHKQRGGSLAWIRRPA